MESHSQPSPSTRCHHRQLLRRGVKNNQHLKGFATGGSSQGSTIREERVYVERLPWKHYLYFPAAPALPARPALDPAVHAGSTITPDLQLEPLGAGAPLQHPRGAEPAAAPQGWSPAASQSTSRNFKWKKHLSPNSNDAKMKMRKISVTRRLNGCPVSLAILWLPAHSSQPHSAQLSTRGSLPPPPA